MTPDDDPEVNANLDAEPVPSSEDSGDRDGAGDLEPLSDGEEIAPESEGSTGDTPNLESDEFPSASRTVGADPEDGFDGEGSHGEERSLLDPISNKTLEKLGRVYVRPEGLGDIDRLVEEVNGRRVLLIHGPSHAGKFATAAAIAARLLSGSRGLVLTYGRKPLEPSSLLEVAQSKDWHRNSVVILENAFAKNVEPDDLAFGSLDLLSDVLERKVSFLIVTTDLSSAGVEPVAAPKREIKPSSTQKMLMDHLDYYSLGDGSWDQLKVTIKDHWKDLSVLLRNPFHIDRFCSRLRELKNHNIKDLRTLAGAIGLIDQKSMRKWFEALSGSEKVVALMAYLFEGLDLQSLEELASQAIVTLRGEGLLGVQDPRELGFRSLLETIRLQEDRGFGEFEDSLVRQEVAWQCSNRKALIWSVLEPIVRETGSSPLWLEDSAKRAALGLAVGRMGRSDAVRFRSSLDEWANSRAKLEHGKGDGVAVLAGYAMSEVVQRDPDTQRRVVVDILKTWIKSRQRDCAWTAGAAIWRIYYVSLGPGRESLGREFKSELLRLLRELTESSGRMPNATGEEILRCVAYALERIGWNDPAEVASLLGTWLSVSRDGPLRRVALRACVRLARKLAGLGSEQALDKYLPLLDLIPAFLANTTASSKVSQELFSSLAMLLGWKSWRAKIGATLLEAANRGPGRVRKTLREALSRYWLTNRSPKAQEIARSIIARSLAMDGILTDRPVLGRCILVVDPEIYTKQVAGPPRSRDEKEKAKKAEETAVRRQGGILYLQGVIEAHMQVSTVLVDEDGISHSGEGGKLSLDAAIPRHGLIMPGFEQMLGEGVRLVLVVTRGPIVDLADAFELTSTSHKILVAVSCELDIPLGVELVKTSRELSREDLERIEESLQRVWSTTLLKLEAREWLPLLAQMGVGPEALKTPEVWLDANAKRLSDDADASEEADLAKKILCVLFWLAWRDLREGLAVAGRWLDRRDEGNFHAMGAAFGRALFRVATDVPRAWPVEKAMLLFDRLALPLANSGKDGIDAVLSAVERWLTEPEFVASLAGDVQRGRGRLLRWAEQVVPERAEVFAADLDRLGHSIEKEDLGSLGEAMESTFERFHIRFKVGQPGRLPELKEGQRYAIIVHDNAQEQQSRWASIACDLFKRLNRDGEDLRPLLFRLGERWPAWVAGDRNPLPAELGFREAGLSRLLGPLLDSGLSPEPTAFLLVLSEKPWIDGEDWVETSWRGRIFSYRRFAQEPWSCEFSAIPDLPRRETEEVDTILEYLRQRLAAGDSKP